MNSEKNIIKDLRVLTEEFIPRRIIHRTGELQAIGSNLNPITEDKKPRNTFIYGPPGTGKTCLSNFVVEELKAQTPLLLAYVNCWIDSTKFKILYNIAHSMGEHFIHRKGTPADELLELIKKRAEDKYCVVILDEVDKMEDKEILYNLVNIEKMSIIAISNSSAVLYNLDPRIRSRLQDMDNIEFRPYSEAEILDILKDRISLGLVSGSIDVEDVRKIAKLCNGDCRVALNILKTAALEAEKSNSKIDIVDSAPQVNLKESKFMEKLTEHQNILFDIIKSKGQISSSEIHKEYISRCENSSIEPLVERSVRNGLEKLVLCGLVSVSGENRWRVYKTTRPDFISSSQLL